MGKTHNTAVELFKTTGRSAPEMTHILKNLGNGDMQKGIMKVLATGHQEGILYGEKRGAIKGGTAVGCLFLGIYFLIKEIREHKAARREIEREKEIYQQAIKESLKESDKIAENNEEEQEEDN